MVNYYSLHYSYCRAIGSILALLAGLKEGVAAVMQKQDVIAACTKTTDDILLNKLCWYIECIFKHGLKQVRMIDTLERF